ncbi:hypothetical protein B7R54_14460 [Subtercola boreus]|uniref:Uncharacterized protein n=1 Tax=Subtercola boreus TaxID=120213 RepID=A0A3E0VK68_9MICO|nr:hypothetical protein [Subtercola boreus]RFA10276.1 hypothetical protein B7R54_14460 [Subtercola boreus]TQL52542.1 hypothetical protein FB464_0024 [Subtercola boreus]
MGLIFDDLVWTSYSQLWLLSEGPEQGDPTDLFRGQVNGLCGTAQAGSAFLVTGTHTGLVPVRVMILTAPPPSGGWEEIVEATFTPVGRTAGLYGWAADASVLFELPAPTYRLRYSASKMDAGKAQDLATVEQPAPDRYQIDLWPAPPEPDSILRRTSDNAGYWHDHGFQA